MTGAAVVSTGDSWYYKDDKDTVHGPHGGDQMLAWLIGGYFDVNLRVRRQDQKEFIPLIHLTQLHGKVPFASEDPRARDGLRYASQPANTNATLTALQMACRPPGSSAAASAASTPLDARSAQSTPVPAPASQPTFPHNHAPASVLREEDGVIIINDGGHAQLPLPPPSAQARANGHPAPLYPPPPPAYGHANGNGNGRRGMASAGSTPNGPSPRGMYGESGPSSPSPAGQALSEGFPDGASEDSFHSSGPLQPGQPLPPPHAYLLPGAGMGAQPGLPAHLQAHSLLHLPQGGHQERSLIEQQRLLNEYRLQIEHEQYKLRLAQAAIPRKADAATSTADLRAPTLDAGHMTDERRGREDGRDAGVQASPALLPLSHVQHFFAGLGISLFNDLQGPPPTSQPHQS